MLVSQKDLDSLMKAARAYYRGQKIAGDVRGKAHGRYQRTVDRIEKKYPEFRPPWPQMYLAASKWEPAFKTNLRATLDAHVEKAWFAANADRIDAARRSIRGRERLSADPAAFRPGMVLFMQGLGQMRILHVRKVVNDGRRVSVRCPLSEKYTDVEKMKSIRVDHAKYCCEITSEIADEILALEFDRREWIAAHAVPEKLRFAR